MKRTRLVSLAALVTSHFSTAQVPEYRDIRFPKGFLLGVSTAAYQVEGGWQADGKGESNWDFYANKVGVTQFVTGKKETGNVAVNLYDRAQYLKDIALMKRLGVNSYRFSIEWSRILPDGTGAVNEKALAHYDQLLDDLKAAGIEPFVTLYHFTIPQALIEKGGWTNPESVRWYTGYADVVFARYGHKVKHFITFNEPYIEHFLADRLINAPLRKEPMNVQYAREMVKVHHQLLANATVIKRYRALNLGGEIGLTANLAPCSPADPANPKDVQAATLQDGLLNRLLLDPLFKGTYPADALATIQRYAPEFQPTAADMALLASVKPDFLGINFYAPALVKYDEHAPMNCNWMDVNPDPVKSRNGPVRPEALHALLMRLKTDYGNPVTYITENGAAFEEADEKKVDGKINDQHRVDYLVGHLRAVQRAVRDGARTKGYFHWSYIDNFEWIFGYTAHFGLVAVDLATQERTPKQSFYVYQAILNQQ
jgi:beta-glucosidase